MTIVVARHQRSISREDFWLRLELNIQLIFEVSTPILNSLPIVGITKVQHGTQICDVINRRIDRTALAFSTGRAGSEPFFSPFWMTFLYK